MKNPIDCSISQNRVGLLLAVWICWLSVSLQPVRATTYYVDAAGGADSNSGVSPAQPWKSLEKVNSTTFALGDRVLLAAGSRWKGKLNPKGSGTPGNTIVIDRYGDGARPIIDGADDVKDTRFDDVLIEGCRIETIDNTGIFTRARAGGSNTPGQANWNRRRITNLRIRHNKINDIAKNAMIIRLADGGVVEHNVCWDTAYRTGTGNTIFSRSSRGTVFQFNEGYLNRSRDYDGSLYDADLESPGCIFQYSYSHDNNHGLFWMCTVQEDANIIVRYNISQNDKGIIFCVNYPNTSCYIYNNVVFVPPHLSPRIIDERRNADKTYYFFNNIIYNLSPTASYNWRNAKRTIANNVFYGYHPDSEPNDPTKITADPMFIDPGSGGLGIETLDGYKLKAGSPCIDSGISIADNGARDFWGNVVPAGSGATDRGAHEYPRAGVNRD